MQVNTPAPADGGQSPSLADLMKPGVQAPVTVPDLAAELLKKEGDPAPDPGTPPAEPPKIPEPAPVDPVLTAEEIEAQRIADEAAAAEADAGDTDFYATLDGMYGEDINGQIDYGTSDPMSPEGVFIREQFIRDKAHSEFAESLKGNDPRAYSYFLHRSSGGSDEEFFSTKSFVLPSLQEVRDSVDLQRELYQSVSLNRGNTPKQTEALLKMAIDNGELLTEAETAYKSIQDNESKVAEAAEKANAANQLRISQDIKVIGDAINKVIDSNDALKFIIPKNEKEAFSEVFRNNVQYDNGKFFLVKPLSPENLSQLMEAELFSYLKGDVSKLVQKQATTVAARRTMQRILPKETVASTATPSAGKALREIL